MRKQLIMGILGLALMLTACSEKADNGESTEEVTEEITEEYIGKVFDAVSESNFSKYEEELLNLNSYDIINDEHDESSNDIIWSFMAISDKGYYYWDDSNYYLYFMDRTTGKSVPLCNRPDCEHEGKECNAYFNSGEDTEEGIYYDMNWLFYYDGYVYILGYDGKGQEYLYKISEDGSVREQYMTLYKKELTQPDSSLTLYTTPKVCIHKGYVYYIIPRETVPTLYRMQLGTEKVEEVFKVETERPTLYRLLAYGDFVFFQAGIFSEDYLNVDGGIFAYNVTNGEIKLVKDEAIATYKMKGTDLYYAKSDGIYKQDTYTGSEEKIVDYDGNVIFSVAGDYIYLKEDYNIKVYNLKGKYMLSICTVEGQQVSNIYFGDSDYIFADGTYTNGGEKQSCLLYVDVSDIANGTAAWQHH